MALDRTNLDQAIDTTEVSVDWDNETRAAINDLLDNVLDMTVGDLVADILTIKAGALAGGEGDRTVRFQRNDTQYVDLAWDETSSAFFLRDQGSSLKKLKTAPGTSSSDVVTKAQLDAVEAAITDLTRRQVVISGENSSGSPAFLGVGTGLTPSLLADDADFIAVVAEGFNANGQAADTLIVKNADESFPAVPANSTSVLTVDEFGDLGYISEFYDEIAPPAPGSQLSILHFEGADTSTTFTDDTGGTWTASGNAQISTAQSHVGSASGKFDGSGDYITGPASVYPTQDAWTLEAWVRFDDFSAGHPVISSDTVSIVVGPTNFSGGGAQSVLKLALSSNNSTFDIGNSDGGTTLSTDTWYHLALVFTGSAYVLYLNGTAEITISSSTKVYSTSTKFRLGRYAADVWYHKGYIDEFIFTPYAKYTAGFTPSTTAAVLAGIDRYWFDRVAMIMRHGNTDDGWTDTPLLPIGECVAGASSISSVTPYAFNGETVIERTSLSTGTTYTLTHNLGTKEFSVDPFLKCKTAGDGGYAVDDRVFNPSYNGASGVAFIGDARNTIKLITGATDIGKVPNKTDGTSQTLTASRWKAGARVRRAY